jgi:hypothetical protein
MLGEIVLSKENITDVLLELDLSELESGGYLLMIKSQNSKLISERLIKIE